MIEWVAFVPLPLCIISFIFFYSIISKTNISYFYFFRYSRRQCWNPEQLQFVSHQNHRLEGDHHWHRCQILLRLQIFRAWKRLYSLSRILFWEVLGWRDTELSEILKGELQSAMSPGKMFWTETKRMLPLILCWRMYRPKAVRLFG